LLKEFAISIQNAIKELQLKDKNLSFRDAWEKLRKTQPKLFDFEEA